MELLDGLRLFDPAPELHGLVNSLSPHPRPRGTGQGRKGREIATSKAIVIELDLLFDFFLEPAEISVSE